MNRAKIGLHRRVRTFLPMLLAVAACGAVTLSDSAARGDLTGPSVNDRRVTQWVAHLIESQHLLKRRLDDEISQRCFDAFLKNVDPWKLYFNQHDINEFAAQRDSIDDMVKQGDVSLAYKIFRRFLARMDERVKLVDELLAMPHDFSTDESMATEPDDLKYLATDEEIRERWRKRIKYELLVQKADGVEPKEAIEKVRNRYRNRAKLSEQTEDDELLELFLSALANGFDPHSSYLSASTLKNFEISMRLELEGIGAQLQYVDGYTVVKKIIPGGAADKHGKLQPEDKIVAVGQGPEGEMNDVVDMKLRDVVEQIRGKRDTKVRLGIMPSDGDTQKVYTITRARIELTDHEARSEILQGGNKADGTPLSVGVIKLPSFYMDMRGARRDSPQFKSTTRDVKRLLDDFNAKDVDCVVLDLRNNGGGSLIEAINLTGLFIDKGPVVLVKDPNGRVRPHEDSDAGVSWSGPLVVLVNKYSASASEIFAGAIQDYQRGLIVGDRATHGKGTVQQLVDLGKTLFPTDASRSFGALKLTIQQFYRPSGDSTQNRGVLADVELPSLSSHSQYGEADLDFAIQFDRIPPAGFAKYHWIDANLVNALAQQSAQRQQNSEEFQKLAKKVKRYVERKERKTVMLREETFLAERSELNPDKEDEKQLEELDNLPDEVVKRDFYFNETLAITTDYYRLLEEARLAGLK